MHQVAGTAIPSSNQPLPRRNTLVRCAIALFAGALIATSAFATQTPAPATPAAPAADHSASYYHYALAHLYEELATTYGRPDYATQAIEEYKLALDNDPDSAYLKTGLADLYYKTGRIRDAVLAAQEQVKQDPNNLDAHLLLGRIYLRSLGGNGTQGGSASSTAQSGEMLKLAIGEYVRIVQLKPDSIENRLLLGQLYALDHDTPHAEEQFKAAQKIDPDSEDVVLSLARLFSEQGDPQRAVDALKAVPATDRTAKIEFALGTSYDQLKQPKQAITAYQSALQMEPDNLDAQRGLAQNLYADGQLDAALKQYQDIAAADPQDAQSYLRIAEIYRRKGKLDDALATLKKAQALVHDSIEVTYNEALIYDSQGHTEDAIQTLKKLIADSAHADGTYSEGEKTNRSIFIDRLAQIYREQNRTTDAIAAYQQLIPLGGDFTVRGYQGEVDAYRDAHQWAQATSVAQDAAKALPKDRGIKLMLAGQLADTGKPDEGIQMAKSLLKGNSEDREVLLALANIDSRLHRWKDAEEQLDKADALSSKPDDKLYVYFLRGSVYDREKRYDEAEAQFRKVLTIDPTNAMTLNYLGYMFADRGVRLNEALDMLRKVVELDPQNGAYLDSLGWVYFKLGQYQLAEENLRKASERIATDPTVHDHLGELYEKTGRLKLAATQWELSVAEYAKASPGDNDPADIVKVQKKLESAKVKLAKENPNTANKQ